MTALDRYLQEFARLQAPQRRAADSSPFAHMMQGVITGVHLGRVDVLIRGQINVVPDVPYLTSYRPGWGDNVWILRWGSDMMVLGDLVPTSVNESIDKMEDWHEVGASGEPAFLNNWVNYGVSNWCTAAFALQSDGWVRMKGLVKNGTLGFSIFTLPPEYRPPFLWGATILANDVNRSMRIQANGSVAPLSNASNAYVSLSGITWPTAEAWERERDTHWFSLVRSLNGWRSDVNFTSNVDVLAQIYRRPDGWRYLKGNIQDGTATAQVGIAFSYMQPEDSTIMYQRLAAHENSSQGLAIVDVAGPHGYYNRVTGGNAQLILVNLHYWSRVGENLLSSDPAYPNKSMQVWKPFSFINGWANYNIGTPGTDSWQRCEYFLDDFGVVHLRGLANGASKTSNVVTNLPVGYRPLEQHLFPTSVLGEVSGRINVYPNGNVEVQGAPAGWASMNGPSWKAEQ